MVVQVLGLTLNEAGPPVLGQECIWAPEKGQKSWLLSGLRPSKEEIQYNCLKFSCKDDGIKLFLVVAGDTVRGQRAQVAEWELHVGHWGNLFFLASARLKQAASGGGKEGNLFPWKFSRLS